MNKANMMQRIHEIGLVPVLRATSAKQAMTIADAIIAGGVTVLRDVLVRFAEEVERPGGLAVGPLG